MLFSFELSVSSVIIILLKKWIVLSAICLHIGILVFHMFAKYNYVHEIGSML